MTKNRTARQRRFWDRIAARYAARPLKNVAAYEAMLSDIAGYLRSYHRVLELGCGTGGTAIRLAPLVAQWTASDFSPAMIGIAQAKPAGKNLQFVVADVGEALATGPCDVICAINVLHLVDDMPATLAQIHAHLPQDGHLIIKIWCFADVTWRIRAIFAMLAVFGLFPARKTLRHCEVIDALQFAGFEVVVEKVFGDYPQNPYFVLRKAAKPAG
jgi:SAM-dependent methyltransferase